MNFLRLGRWILDAFYGHIHIYFPLLEVSLRSVPTEISGECGLVLAAGLKSTITVLLQVLALILCKVLSRLR